MLKMHLFWNVTLPDPEYEDIMILQNVANYLPSVPQEGTQL
jgi:hypothetical protein